MMVDDLVCRDPKPVFALSKWNDSQTKCFHSPFIRGGFNFILNYVPNHTHCVQKYIYRYIVVVSSFGGGVGRIQHCHLKGDLCASLRSSLTRIPLCLPPASSARQGV